MFRVTIQDTAPGHTGSVTLDADFIPMSVEIAPEIAARMATQVHDRPGGTFVFFPDNMTKEQAEDHIQGNRTPNPYRIDPRVVADLVAWEKEIDTEIASEKLGGNVVKIAAAQATKAAIAHTFAILTAQRQDVEIAINAPAT